MEKTEDDTLCNNFNVTQKRAYEIIDLVKPLWEKFIRGEITNGELCSASIEMDELTMNEKCFLIFHCASCSLIAMQEVKNKQAILKLIAGDY